jgi:hypothetical protein
VAGGEAALEVGEQLGELVGEVVGQRLRAVALERLGGHRVGAGGAADAEVDATGEEAGEDAEALRHLERAVVGQHDAAAADAEARGGGGDRADQHLRRGPGDQPSPMVLGDPIAVVAEPIGELGEVDRVAQRPRRADPLRHRRLVEDAEPQTGGRHLSRRGSPCRRCS